MFRFAILGAGGIAHQFANAVHFVPDCEVIAVGSKSKERAVSFAKECNIPAAYGDYEELLIKEKPDCVYVSSTTNDHARISKLAISHNIPVLCEKTMCVSKKEAEDVFALAKQKNVFIMEAMWSRFLPTILKLREWLSEERIGDVKFLEYRNGFCCDRNPEGRMFSRALGGGAALDLAVYGYDISTFLLPGKVHDLSFAVIDSGTHVDSTDLITMWIGDVLVSILAMTDGPVRAGLTIYGTKGRMYLTEEFGRKDTVLEDEKGNLVERFNTPEVTNGFEFEIMEVIRCIKEGKLQSDTVPWSLTLEYLEVVDRIFDVIDHKN